MGPLNKLIIYSLSMIILPIMSYFISDYLFKNFTTDHWANIYSAIVAVLVVHCVLFSFVYQAYHEDRIETMRISEKKAE